MAEEMVMRSVYVRPSEDALLRELAFDLKVSKSELIRAAISLKLRDWLASDDEDIILKDVEFGRNADMEALTGGAAPEEAPANPDAKSGRAMPKLLAMFGASGR